MRIHQILISVLLLGSPYASAANWTQIDGAQGLEIHVDSKSIAPAGGGLVKAWVRQSHDEVQPSVSYPKFEYKSAILLYLFNCSERTTNIIQENFFNDAYGQGNAVSSRSFPRNNIQMIDVIPGSIGEGILEYVCEASKRKSKKK